MTRYIIGVDLGGTNLKFGLLNLNYEIKDKKILDTRKYLRKLRLIQVIIDSIKEIIKDNRLTKKDVLGIGLGFPGPIDYRKGIVHFLPNIPGWKNVKLKAILKKRLGMDIFMDNDANLMCLAEHKIGAAKGFRNTICLTLGTGVGGGLVIENRLYRGGAYAAGEIGHVPINEYGPRCNCNGRACLESYVGNQRIMARAKSLFKRKISLEELSRLARDGNKKAISIWQETGRKLGLALSGVVNLLNPDCIVIGGGLSNVGGVLFKNIINTIKDRAMPVQAGHVKILKAKLGDDAGIMGAAIMVKMRGAR